MRILGWVYDCVWTAIILVTRTFRSVYPTLPYHSRTSTISGVLRTTIIMRSIYLYIIVYNYILLTGLAVNMARYCTSVQKYFPEPKAKENTAHECNVSPYWPLIQSMRDLLYTSLTTGVWQRSASALPSILSRAGHVSASRSHRGVRRLSYTRV